MMISHLHIPHDIRQLSDRLAHAGKKAYLVGGAVRDHFLKRPTSDYDVATDALPQEVMKLFPRVIPTGIAHGTVTVLLKTYDIEVTTFRIDRGYSDGRRPDSVEFSMDIERDLERRDFTMNAIAYDLRKSTYIDPFEGRQDISRKIIRAVGDPVARFSEDGLRPLRAVRFASQLGFSIEDATLSAISASLERFMAVSAERVRDEFCKILMSPWAAGGITLLDTTGLLALIVPELLEGKGIGQKGVHEYDVFEHSCLAMQAAPVDLVLRLAALFHDLGKPRSLKYDDEGSISFHDHESISEQMTREIMKRLKFPNSTIDHVCVLVKNHMFNYEHIWSDAAVRRFIARVGIERIDDLLALRRADETATASKVVDPSPTILFRERINSVLANDHTFGLKDLAVNGNDLASIGITRGPEMGIVLHELMDTVLDDPDQNEKTKLLEIASKIKTRIGSSV
jgi:poly(A) polymerase/tRNA nucleotidyltransferase (CCA-adding enzyme)